MQLTIKSKQLGKKRAIGQSIIEIADLPQNATLQNLITNVVKQQVSAFNQRKENPTILSILSKENIAKQSEKGKIGFNDSYNAQQANEQQAIDNALLAFEDGIYCVFVGEEQIENLNQNIEVTENTIVTFVRLTFLAGSYW